MKYLGIDFGLKRVGLATSEGQIASSWKVVEVSSFDDSIIKMIRIIKAENIDQVVVGMPEGKTGKLVKKFIKRLQDKNVNAAETDETLSSQQATQLLVEIGIPKKKRTTNDATAAAIILQNYLDSQ